MPAKSDQFGKRVLALRLDPKLRRAAYAQSGVFGERLVKADVAVFAYDRLQLSQQSRDPPPESTIARECCRRRDSTRDRRRRACCRYRSGCARSAAGNWQPR